MGIGSKERCHFCEIDIGDVVKVKCAVCTDYTLCVECFAQGAQSQNHLNSHDYRVIELLDFPVVDSNWSAEEELQLLDGLEQYGMGNWVDISEQMTTKSLEEIKQHYLKYYIEPQSFPLPDVSTNFSQEQINTLKRKTREQRDNWKPPPKALKVGKPITSQPSSHEVAGYMPLREEFETELENEAETIISSLSFNDDDSPQDIELKSKILEIYNWKLERRIQRRKFLIDRGLINYRQQQVIEKKRTKDERDLVNSFKPFSKFQTTQDFDLFIEGIINEQNIRNRIVQLQEYRSLGITTMASAENYEGDRRKREAEIKKSKDSQFYYDKYIPRNRVGREKDDVFSPKAIQKKTSGTPLDLCGAAGVQLLSPKEYELCSNLRIMPKAYILIKEMMIREYNQNGSLKKAQARQMIRIDVNKTGKVYDFFVSCGWVKPPLRG